MTINNTTAAAILKQVYAQKAEMALYKTNPFFSALKKKSGIAGSSHEVPVIYAAPQGRSAVASTAITNGTGASAGMVRFAVTLARNISECGIDGLTWQSSKTSPQAFVDALKMSMEAQLINMAADTSFAIFRDGMGYRGQIISTQSITGATTITLQDASDTKSFEPGQVIVASTASDGTSIKQTSSTDNTAKITAIDISAGTLTFDVAVDSFGSNDWAAADYLYVQGDPAAKIRGLSAWIPSTVTSTSFFGVNRTAHADRLGGIRYDGSGQSVREALIDGANTGAERGASLDTAFISFSKFSDLSKEMGSQANQTNFKMGSLGFAGINLMTPAGEIKVVPDRSCPNGVAYLLNMSSWYLGHSGPAPINVVDEDGHPFIRSTTDDAYNARLYSYCNLICTSPGQNVRVALG